MNNIVKILLVVFSTSFPSSVFGGIGDVYYCSMKNFVVIKDFKVSEFKLQKFKFKITESGLKFGSKSDFFKNIVIEDRLALYDNLFAYGTDGYDVFTYEDGIFNFSSNNFKSIISLSGTCEKF